MDPADETAEDEEEDDGLDEVSARPWSLESAKLFNENRRNSVAAGSRVAQTFYRADAFCNRDITFWPKLFVSDEACQP